MERFWKIANVVFGALLSITACGGGSYAPRTFAPRMPAVFNIGGRGRPSGFEHYVTAELAFENGNFPTAVAEMEAVLDADDDDPYLTLRLAAFCIADGDAARGEALILSVIDDDPRNPEAWLALSRKHDLFGEAAAALSSAQKAVSLDPAFLEGGLWLGELLWSAGKPGEAVAVLTVTARHHPRNGRVAVALSRAYLAMDNYPEAERVLNAAHKVTIVPAAAWIALGRAAHARGASGVGATYLERAFAMTPPASGLRLALVDMHLAAGHPVAARRQLENVPCDAPCDPALAIAVSRRWVDAGAPFEAREVLGYGLADHPSNSVLRLALAAVEIRLARLEVARLLIDAGEDSWTDAEGQCRDSLTAAIDGWPDTAPDCPNLRGEIVGPAPR